MIKKYIRGNKTRPEEALNELIKLGGKNTRNLKLLNDELRYFIGENNTIHYSTLDEMDYLITECFEEIILPPSDLKPKIKNNMIKKFIRGNETRRNEVIAELEKLGGINSAGWKGDSTSRIYIINNKNIIVPYDINSDAGKIILECFEEIILPPQQIETTIKLKTSPATNDSCSGCFLLKIKDCLSVAKLLNLPDCKTKDIIHTKID